MMESWKDCAPTEKSFWLSPFSLSKDRRWSDLQHGPGLKSPEIVGVQNSTKQILAINRFRGASSMRIRNAQMLSKSQEIISEFLIKLVAFWRLELIWTWNTFSYRINETKQKCTKLIICCAILDWDGQGINSFKGALIVPWIVLNLAAAQGSHLVEL